MHSVVHINNLIILFSTVFEYNYFLYLGAQQVKLIAVRRCKKISIRKLTYRMCLYVILNYSYCNKATI